MYERSVRRQIPHPDKKRQGFGMTAFGKAAHFTNTIFLVKEILLVRN